MEHSGTAVQVHTTGEWWGFDSNQVPLVQRPQHHTASSRRGENDAYHHLCQQCLLGICYMLGTVRNTSCHIQFSPQLDELDTIIIPFYR